MTKEKKYASGWRGIAGMVVMVIVIIIMTTIAYYGWCAVINLFSLQPFKC